MENRTYVEANLDTRFFIYTYMSCAAYVTKDLGIYSLLSMGGLYESSCAFVTFVDRKKVSFWAVICNAIDVLKSQEMQDVHNAFRMEPNGPVSFNVSDHGDMYHSRVTYETQCILVLVDVGQWGGIFEYVCHRLIV